MPSASTQSWHPSSKHHFNCAALKKRDFCKPNMLVINVVFKYVTSGKQMPILLL